MKAKLFALIFIIGCSEGAQAKKFIGLTGARLNADYRSVKITQEVKSDASGNIEMLGPTFGLFNYANGAVGTEYSISLLGTNSQKISPDPGFGTPWYYRLNVGANYMFTFGLYFYSGVDLMGSFNRQGEDYYFGLGVNAGIGYKISEKWAVNLGFSNSSILYAGENGRYLRGEFLEGKYMW